VARYEAYFPPTAARGPSPYYTSPYRRTLYAPPDSSRPYSLYDFEEFAEELIKKIRSVSGVMERDTFTLEFCYIKEYCRDVYQVILSESGHNTRLDAKITALNHLKSIFKDLVNARYPSRDSDIIYGIYRQIDTIVINQIIYDFLTMEYNKIKLSMLYENMSFIESILVQKSQHLWHSINNAYLSDYQRTIQFNKKNVYEPYKLCGYNLNNVNETIYLDIGRKDG
jgi:hypothetical protein